MNLITTLLPAALLLHGALATAAPLRLYFANSYTDEFFWTRDIINGTLQELRHGGIRDPEVRHGNLDAFTYTGPAQMKEQGRRILADIRRWQPDYVICTDDDALQWVGLHIDHVPVVFNGVNGPKKYIGRKGIRTLEKPGANITGVYQTTYYRESLELLRRIYPQARTFAVISDRTTTSQEQLKELQELQAGMPGLPLRHKASLSSKSFAEWQRFIRKWEPRVDAFFYLNANHLEDSQGKKLNPKMVHRWIAKNVRKPGAGTWAGIVEGGVLVSAADAAVNQGIATARLILEIRAGKQPGDLPVVSPPNGVPVINVQRARDLKVSIPHQVMEIFIDNGRVYH